MNIKYIPNELVNIILSYVERPKINIIIKKILNNYNEFLMGAHYCRCNFKTYFFRVFLPIWKMCPANYPYLQTK